MAIFKAKKKEATQTLPKDTCWDSEEGKELISKLLKELTPYEVDILMQYKRKFPNKNMGNFGWAFNYAESKIL